MCQYFGIFCVFIYSSPNMDQVSKADKFFGEDDEEVKPKGEELGKKRTGKKKKTAKQKFFEELKDNENTAEVVEEEPATKVNILS